VPKWGVRGTDLLTYYQGSYSPPRKAIKREPEVINLITPPRPKRESSELMEALGPFEFQFTLDADEDVLSTASAPRYSASLHDTDADGETDSDYVPDRIVIDSDDEVEAKPAHTEWLNPAYQSYVKRGPFAITKAIAVSRIEYADFLPDYIPIPEERTAYIFDLRDSSFDIDRHGKAMTADALLKSRCQDSWTGPTGAGDSTVDIDVFENFIPEIVGPITCRRSRLT
ncbi:hypothetical protein GGF50DRAFT_93322, partial [Schizophyllum commune]